MFTIDTETGFPDAVLINSAFGLGENVVQGEVSPDEFLVYKPLLDNEKLCPILRKKVGEKEKTMIFARGAGITTKNVSTPRSRRAKFSLEDEDVLTLARWAKKIEDHYSERRGVPTPMDIEWAKDFNGNLFIVQARPETVQSRGNAAELVSYSLVDANPPKVSSFSDFTACCF
jgi:pyruvate,water dikinase